MLDIHPPHGSVHSWRDFLIHIATIVVGLLIAIGLEQTVEYFHHRHLLHQARENLREEIEDNQKILEEDRRYLESNQRTMLQNIAILRQVKANGTQPSSTINFPWHWSSPSAAAWNTARDTGALALMPYSEVQGYTLLYGQQEDVNRQAKVYVVNQNSASAPLVGSDATSSLSPAQVQDLIRGCGISVRDILLLKELMKSLEQNYNSALKAS